MLQSLEESQAFADSGSFQRYEKIISGVEVSAKGSMQIYIRSSDTKKIVAQLFIEKDNKISSIK